MPNERFGGTFNKSYKSTFITPWNKYILGQTAIMQSLNDPAVMQQVKDRFNKLTAASQPQWGKMTVSQMLAHCSNALEANLDEHHQKPGFFGSLLGKIEEKCGK